MKPAPLIRFLAATLLVAFIAGCAGTQEYDETRDWSAAKFYSEAKAALQAGDYEQAIKHYETLESRFPYGRYAQQAQLEVAYAYYRYDEPDSAIAAIDRFLKLNPLHPYVDYAMYLKGLVNFNRGVGFLDRWIEDDYSKRDQQAARQAYRDFEALIKKFPDSRYASDARQRLVYLRNTLAMHEVHVARYYMKRAAWVAAANRARQVIQNYQGTPATPEALLILVKAYRALEMNNLAEDAKRVLARNYPERVSELDISN
ncbi:MAG: outer membrane protein assembly factor BamD [Gammaproteobacteria bacterium]